MKPDRLMPADSSSLTPDDAVDTVPEPSSRPPVEVWKLQPSGLNPPPLLFLNSSSDQADASLGRGFDRRSINSHVQRNARAKRRELEGSKPGQRSLVGRRVWTKSQRFHPTDSLPLHNTSKFTQFCQANGTSTVLSPAVPGNEEAFLDMEEVVLDSAASNDDAMVKNHMLPYISRHRFHLPLTSSPNETSISSFLDNVEFDPFATTATPFTRDMNSLLHHFLEIASPRVFVNRTQTITYNKWLLSMALSQPAVLFGVLAFAAADIQAKRGELDIGSQAVQESNQLVPNYTKYKVKAIQLLNEKLCDDKEARDISTILGIVRLLAIEVLVGNHDEIVVHLNGLRKLIQVRGGDDGISSTLMGSTLASNTWFAAAALTRSMPPAPSPRLVRASVSPSILSAISASNEPDLKEIGTTLNGERITLFLERKILEAYHETKELILFREFCAKTDSADLTPADEQYFGHKLCKVHYILLSSPHERFEQDIQDSKQEVCRMALLIFIHTQYMRQSPSSALYRSLTRQLIAALQHCSLVSLWIPHEALWAWILFLGAHISQGQAERSWFTMNLAFGIKGTGLREWTAVKKWLTRVFYVERTFGESYQAIWQEVRLLMAAMSAS